MKRLIDFSSRFRILKGGKISLVISAFLGGAIIANAAPSGGTVTSGNATINQSGNVTNINQSTQKASINWNDFSVKSHETVNFNQPNVNSITLNRVIGNEKSVIDGALNANGQVWILNSNGVLFGKNASINTAGLLASTAELSDTDFQNGNYEFKNSSSNSVINLGTIEVTNNAYVVLASNEVKNTGTIKAVKGKVHLVGADSYSLNLNGNSIVNLKVDKGVLDALVENSGHIIADGGEIFLTTNAVNELLKGVVNNTGILEANSLDGITGKVELFAHGGEAQVGGTIEAQGGFVETSGKDFNFLGADIKAGQWLIDPVNITIGSTLASSIQTALGSGNVTISTDGGNTPDTSSGESGTTGNIYVNSNISWTSDKNLTLQAANGVSGTATINIGDAEASFTIDQLGNSTFSGKISGKGSFNKLGSGTLTLSGSNEYWGATVVDAGTLAITNNTGLGAAFDTYGSGTFVNSGATLDLQNVAVGEETIILNGGTLATTTGNSSLDGDIILDYGTSTFSVANGATLTIDGKLRDSMKLVQELYDGYYEDDLDRDFGTTASLSLTSMIDYGAPNPYVSARWLGYFKPEETGQYTFYASSDDASLVYLGTESQNLLDLLQRNDGINGYTANRLLINNSGVSRETNTGTYTVNAGEVYPIIIYYGNNIHGGSIDFKYRAPSMGSSYTFDLSNEFSISPQANPTAQNITKVGNGTLVFTANNDYTGTTNINEGTLKIANNAPSEATSGYYGAGQLVIAPTSNSFTTTFDTSTAGFTFGSTLGGLTIGKSTNTADIAINSAISIAGDITLYGKDIGINEKLESTGANSTITLDGSGSVTDGASGYLLASNLLLSDGAVTLDNTNNNDIDNIAASGVDSLYFYDTDGFNIGSTIGGITGISSTGLVKLSAGADESAGTSTGGDITITGTPTITSTSSYVRLFTGSISGSTGLSSVVNAGNFRYNSDESTTNFATAIGATGTTYAIYREQPTATVIANDKTITYGDNNPIYDGIETGIVNGDESLIEYTLTGGTTSPSGYTNAGTYTIDADATALTGLGYNVMQEDDGTLTVDKATLSVTANDDAKFVTQADNTGIFNGVSYNGFVGSETETVLGGVLNVMRTNSGTDTAGIYNDVLVASGLTADNYDINYINGDYTIVPSNELLVRVTNVSDTYGTNTQYSLSSVEYFDGSSIVTLGVDSGTSSIDGTNLVSITDGAGGSATFTLSPQDSSTSTAGKLKVGSYQLGVSGAVTDNSVNFSDTITIVGAHQVNQKSITASTTGGVSKVYDGTTSMNGVTLELNTLETGDVVTVDGLGSFSSKNAGINLSYTINNVVLSGTDADNYYLSGGNSFIGSDGVITQKDVTVSYTSVDKTYDGSINATVTDSTNDFIIGDDIAITENAVFTDKNVGDGKSVTISSIALSGADASNYNLVSATSAITTANITRLDTVTWIGGTTGNWFDPANWAGGAVPDLSNVANVVIPTGTVVTFDTSGATGLADASAAVNIDSLGTLGSLTMVDGTLNVLNDMTLDTFIQNGGILTAENITLDTFAQTAGTTSTTGNFTVNDQFLQGTSGSISVGGDTSINDNTGSMVIGNLNTTGATTITSIDGDITQASGTTIVSGGTTTLDAGTNDIILDNANNDFQSTVDATGNNIAITDVNALEAVLDATGDSVLNAGGDLVVSGETNDLTTTTTNGGTTTFGDTKVNGDLDVTSDGEIAQTGPIVVVGTTTLDAGTNDIILDNANNDFQSTVDATGNNIAITDVNALEAVLDATGDSVLNAGGDLVVSGETNDLTTTTTNGGTTTFGDTKVNGDLDVTSDGEIAQTGPIVVVGTTTLDAGTNDIILDNANNDFQSTVDATGNNIAITDVNALEAVLDATGDSVLNAGGDLVVSGETNDLTTTTTNGGTTTFGDTKVNGDLDVTSDGEIAQTGPIVVVGTTTLDAGTNDIILDNANNDFQSTVDATGNNIAITDVNALEAVLDATGDSVLNAGGDLVVSGETNDLTTTTTNGGTTTFGDTKVNGDLDVTSDGEIAQTGPIVVVGTTTLDAGTNDIILDNANNDFQSTVDATGNNIAITDVNALEAVLDATGDSVLNAGGDLVVSGETNDLTTTTTNGGTTTFGDTKVNGDLDVTSDGEIAQTGPIVVVGTTTLDAGTNDIILDNANNDFQSTVDATGNNIAITDVNALEAVLDATGDSVLNAGGDLVVSGETNDLTTTTTNGGTTTFGDTKVNGDLDVTSDGEIAQTGPIVVVGTTTLDAGTNDIILDNANNDFQSTVDATGNNIAITDVNALEAVLDATGDSVLNAGGDLVVSGETNDLTTTTTNGGTTTFGDTKVNGDLDVTSDGEIAQTGPIVVVGTTTLDAGTNDIILDNANNDFQSTVDATGNNIAITDVNALEAVLDATGDSVLNAGGDLVVSGETNDLTTTTTNGGTTTFGDTKVNGDLDVTSDGEIAQTGPIVVVGTTTLDAGTNDIILDNANNDFQSTVDATGNNIAITDVNALEAVLDATGDSVLNAGGDLVVSGETNDLTTTTTNGGTTTFGDTKVNGDLDVTSDGEIAQTGPIVVVGTTTLDAGTNDIILDNANNDFQSTVDATGNNIAITDVNALEAVLDATGDSVLNAGGDLVVSGETNDLTTTTTNGGTTTFGDTKVNGDLDVTSDGEIAQTGPIVVVGTTTLDAGTNDIILDNANNDFQSTVDATGNNIVIVKSNKSENDAFVEQIIIPFVEQVITPIANTTVIPQFLRMDTKPVIENIITKSIVLVKNEKQVNIVSQPTLNQNTEMISMRELEVEKNDTLNAELDIRVPVADGSRIEVVKSGVRLPNGLEQLFFIIKDDELRDKIE